MRPADEGSVRSPGSCIRHPAAILLVAGLFLASCDGDGPQLVSRDAAGPGTEPGCMVEDGTGVVRSWTVRPGDSLTRIARRVYGDERLWKAILEANRDAIGPGETIQPGQVLEIPWEGE